MTTPFAKLSRGIYVTWLMNGPYGDEHCFYTALSYSEHIHLPQWPEHAHPPLQACAVIVMLLGHPQQADRLLPKGFTCQKYITANMPPDIYSQKINCLPSDKNSLPMLMGLEQEFLRSLDSNLQHQCMTIDKRILSFTLGRVTRTELKQSWVHQYYAVAAGWAMLYAHPIASPKFNSFTAVHIAFHQQICTAS